MVWVLPVNIIVHEIKYRSPIVFKNLQNNSQERPQHKFTVHKELRVCGSFRQGRIRDPVLGLFYGY
jgi:hypothetical protein